MPKETMKAVHDDDLEVVLRGLGIYSDMLGGRLKCAFCSDVISWENLHALLPDSGTVKCACSKVVCIERLMQGISHGKPAE